jgi:predicted TIM-barrel fold metal-dependent hydrolase
VIIDSHVHIKGGDTYRRELDPDRTIYRMDQAGIDRSVVFSICLPTRSSNELTLRSIRGREERLIPYAHAVPLEGAVALDEVRRAVGQGCRGLKLHFGELQGEEPTDALFVPFLELAAALGVPVLLDCNNRPAYPDRWAGAVPEAKLIIPHLGSSNDQHMNWRFFDVAKRHPNVWLDTSYTSGPWMIWEAFHALGPRKLIWGSDGGGDYYPPLVELAKLQVWEFPPADSAAMLAGNILALLGEAA